MIIELKVNQLIDLFSEHASWCNEYGSLEQQANKKHAIKCALICANQVLGGIQAGWEPSDIYLEMSNYKFWSEIKTKLESLLKKLN